VKYIIKYILGLIFYPLKYIVPKNNTVIISSNSPKVYSGNARYLFEYLSEKNSLNVIWYTESKLIKSHLIAKKYKYITLKNPIKLIYNLLKAKVVINDGDAYVNFFNILDNPFTQKICTFHGCAAKAAIYDVDGIISPDEQRERLNKFDYINFPSDASSVKYAEAFNILQDKIFSAGFPRCDQFFDKELVTKKYKSKSIARSFAKDINDDSRIILYTPTWRPYEYNLPLFDLDNFSQDKFNDWLKENNYYFFYTIHTAIKPNRLLQDSDRIRYIDLNNHPLFDVNDFMNEVDVLLNDYSATSTDFALLDRAQIFCMPDYDIYWNYDGVSFIPIDDANTSYRDMLPGKEALNYNQLTDMIKNICDDYETYVLQYKSQSADILNKFYNIENTKSANNINKLINKILHQ